MEVQKKENTLRFIDLISKETKIEIPIIQRDYAQGRIEQKEVRNNFLSALHKGLSEESPIKLDFIYGSKVDDNFQPLDGQQRLTTLFLLHWYASVKDGIINEKKKLLKRFSYETRITSREFCVSLIDSDIKILKDETISSTITDSKWFFLYWNSDPTIDAMLRTLDDIHVLFFELNDLWNKLINTNLISFYYIELEDIGLTDDLYIKMNARGKLLSPFENFKASFEKKINDSKWEKDFNQIDSFAFKIDTTWTDFFWTKYRKDNIIDDSLMRFMSCIIMIHLAQEKSERRRSYIDSINKNFNSLKAEYINFESYKYLYNCFEIYNKLDDINILSLNFPLWRHQPEINNLSEVIYDDRDVSYTQKVIFFAQTEYLLKNPIFNEFTYQDWMRVVRNIISRGSIEKGGKRPDIIRSLDTFIGVINLISELSIHSNNIYQFLSTSPKMSSSFAKEQIEEEKEKAKLIIANSKFKEIIFNMEDLTLFKGRISFALNCIDYNFIVDNFNFNLFEKIYGVILTYFNNFKEDDVSNDIRRALLTIEVNNKYEFYNYWWSYWNVGNAEKRCLIENFRELEFIIYNTTESSYFKQLILKLCSLTPIEILDSFVPPEDMPQWKVKLITEPVYLNKKAKSKFIAIPNDESCCYLLVSKRPRVYEGTIKIT